MPYTQQEEALLLQKMMKKLKEHCHNIRTSRLVKYVTEDSVFYKREDKNERCRPEAVTGPVNQKVFVKHGSVYICVHP